MSHTFYVIAGVIGIVLLFFIFKSHKSKDEEIDMTIWKPTDEQWSAHRSPINILSIVKEKNGERSVVEKGEDAIWGLYDHIYVTWEDLEDKCVYTTDVVIPEQDARALKAKQSRSHYYVYLFGLRFGSHGECVVTVDLNDSRYDDDTYKVFKGQVTHEYDQQLQQELGVNSMDAYFQKKYEAYQQRCFLLDLRSHVTDSDIKYATPFDYPVTDVSFSENWDFPNLGLIMDSNNSQRLSFPGSVKMEWVALNDKKAYKADYELPIPKLFDILKEIDFETDKHYSAQLIFNFTCNGEANLYLQFENQTFLVDTHIKGQEDTAYDVKSIDEKIDDFESDNYANNFSDSKQYFFPYLTHCDMQRYNYSVNFTCKDNSTICFVNGEKCKSSQKMLKGGFSLLQEVVMKKGKQVYCFDWEETVRVFNTAYGKDKSQPGVLNMSLTNDNSLKAELVVNGKKYPFKTISPSYSKKEKKDKENIYFWGAYYTSPKYHPVRILRTRFMGDVWKNSPILNESRDFMASFCVKVPNRWKVVTDIPKSFELYWISYADRKVYHTHGIIPESVKKELGKDKNKDRCDLISIRCLPDGKIALYLEDDDFLCSDYDVEYSTEETHTFDSVILEESGANSMREFFDRAEKEVPCMNYAKEKGLISSLISKYNKIYNYKKKIVLDNCDKKDYTPRYMFQYSNLCYERRITNEYLEETHHSVPHLFKMWMNSGEYRYFVEVVFKEEDIFDLFDKAYKGKEDTLGELNIHFDGKTQKTEVNLIVDNKVYPVNFYYFCSKWVLATIKNGEAIEVFDDKDYKGELKEERYGLFLGM